MKCFEHGADNAEFQSDLMAGRSHVGALTSHGQFVLSPPTVALVLCFSSLSGLQSPTVRAQTPLSIVLVGCLFFGQRKEVCALNITDPLSELSDLIGQ